MAQVKPLKLLVDGNFAQIDTNSDDLTANTVTSKQLNITESLVGEKIVVQANPGDSSTKIVNVKNSSGTSVASIDELGNIISRNIQSSGDLSVAQGAIISLDLLVEGNTDLQGNVILGSAITNSIQFLGVASTSLNMGLQKIVNVQYPTDATDVASKQYVDDNLSAGGWSTSGNTLSSPGTTEFIGSINSADVIFKRNNEEFLRFLEPVEVSDFGRIKLFEETFLTQEDFDGAQAFFIRTESAEEFSPNDSLPILVRTGTTQTGNSGDIIIGTGGSSFGNTGNIALVTDEASLGTRGKLIIDAAEVEVYSDVAPFDDDTHSLGKTSKVWKSVHTNTLENNHASLELKLEGIQHSSDVIPSLDKSLDLGSSTLHYSSVFSSDVGTGDNSDFSLKRNSSPYITLDAAGVNLNNQQIKSLALPTDAQDAVNLQYAQTNLWGTSGNTLSSPLTTQFIGSTNSADVIFKRNNEEFIRFLEPVEVSDFGRIKLFEETFLTQEDFDGVQAFFIRTESAEEFSPNDSLPILVRTGTTQTGNSGDIIIGTGGSLSGNTGNIALVTDETSGGTRGGLLIDSAEVSIFSDTLPGENLSYSLGSSGLHWTEVYTKNLGIASNEDLGIIQNNNSAAVIDATDVTINRHVVIQTSLLDSEAKVFEVKNATGGSVAYIDEDGDATFQTLTVIGNMSVGGALTVIDVSETESSLSVTGDLTVQGNTFLGNEVTDTITFTAVSDSNLNMGSNNITNLSNPVNPQDASTKNYTDTAITTLDNAKWDKTGNSLTGTEKFGSSNNQDVTFVRNDITQFQMQDTQVHFDTHLVVQASVSDNESKIFNVKNSLGVSVASIDEDGDMIVRDLYVGGVETVIGTITAESDLNVQGSLLVEGNTTLGDASTDVINFVAKAGTVLDMDNHKITNLTTPTASGDAANKFYVDDTITTALGTLGTLALPTDGVYGGVNGNISGVAEDDTYEDAFDKVEVILGKLAPAKPANLSTKTLAITGTYTAYESGTGTPVLRSNVIDNTTPLAQTPTGVTNGFWDAEDGTITAEVDSLVSGSRVLTSANDEGTYSSLRVLSDYDFYNGQAGKELFWYALIAGVQSASPLSLGAHSYRLLHSKTGNTPVLNFFVDDPQAVTVTGQSIVGSGSGRYISGVPSLNTGDSITASFTVNNAIRQHYNPTRIASASSTLTNSVNQALPGVAPTSGSTFSGNIALSVLSARYAEQTSVTCTGFNSKGTTGTASAVSSIRVDTVSNEVRVKSGQGQFPVFGISQSQYGDTFDSTVSLVSSGNEELQMLDGQYQFPTGNYTANLPVNGPNYSAASGGSFNNYRWVTINLGAKTGVSSVTLNIVGGVNLGSTTLISDFAFNVKVDGDIPTNGWVDGNAAYAGVGNPSNDGDAALVIGSSSVSTKVITFGATVRTGNVYVRVGIPLASNKRFTNITIL